MNKQKIEKFILFIFILEVLFVIFIPTGHAYDQAVKEAQARLSEKGYNPGPADGLIGKKTIEAIRTFQTDNSLLETGKLDPKTRSALGIKAEPLAEKSGKLKSKSKFEPVALNCTVLGINAWWTNGGRTMVVGSIKNLRCGEDDIELETNNIVDHHIATKKYGQIKFDIPDLNTIAIVFYLSNDQKRMLKKYIVK